MTRTVSPSPEQSGEPDLPPLLYLEASILEDRKLAKLMTDAADALESAQAEIARLTAILGNHDDLPEQILRDADEMEACGAGNEAANMRKLVARLLEARAALKGNQP